jgi:hypothetical protein
MKSYKNFINEERKHKYNSIAKIKNVLGSQPSDAKIKAFIKKEYDLDNEDHMDIVSDIMGYYHLDPEEFFDEDGNLLESSINEAKTFGEVYEIATPNTKSEFISMLKKSKNLKNIEIITNFNSPEGLESVLVFGASESIIKKFGEEIGDLIAFKYDLVNRTEIMEGLVNEGKESGLNVFASSKEYHKKLSKWLSKSDYHAEENDNYFFFAEESDMLDELEEELDKEFIKAKISARFEED